MHKFIGNYKEIKTDLDKLKLMMSDQGVTQLYYKILAPNDNSKNQPYFGAHFSVLNSGRKMYKNFNMIMLTSQAKHK